MESLKIDSMSEFIETMAHILSSKDFQFIVNQSQGWQKDIDNMV